MTEEIKYGNLTQAQLNAFLEHALLARLATAVPSKEDPAYMQPHNTPVWFWWDGQSLFISAFQSTRKVKEVKRNPYIAVLMDTDKPIDGVTAVLMEGKAELLLDAETVQEMSRVIYSKYMGPEGVLAADPQSWIVDPENSIIRLVPTNVYTW
jgi:nitroimidazol reductase NimA-like FMN-containing flavoprotein (pyridoxamine 5'-phosphate oxidase superfamily)